MSLRCTVRSLRNPLAMGVRGMASEQELRARITSTTNIQKITKSMKMVAAAKMKKEEERCVRGSLVASFPPFLPALTHLLCSLAPSPSGSSRPNRSG